jgi:signal transduction histidine kinase
MGNFKWDLQTNTLSWSKGMYAIYGLSPDTFEPTLENIMPFTHPEEVERVTNNALKALATQSVLPLGYRIIAADGQVKHVFGSGIILDDPTGRKILLGTLQDVSDEKEKEQQLLEVNEQLKENNLALEKSNRDLEQFAHIASHDLQEPLRKIQTFANLLQRRRDDPAELEKYTQKIEDSASRMSQLIQSVLNYSRVSQSQDLFEPTDLNQIIARIRTDFELVIEEKNAVVQSDDLPVIPGVPLQLSQLFSNLISNALKFSTEHPLITISVSDATPAEISARTPLDPAREYVHIWVEDNGIGFSQQYSERIFAIFQRLHDRQTYAGTGIGLALCKKIVDRHGGDISAQGEVGKGARFDIYLPKK